jgi:hypothetical protein
MAAWQAFTQKVEWVYSIITMVSYLAICSLLLGGIYGLKTPPVAQPTLLYSE